MGGPRLATIDSVAGLRACAPAWDDLWWPSDVTMPTCRAELVAQWVEQFASWAVFRALVVADQGQWVAALALVGRKVARVIRAGGMPCSEWSSSGELLLDPAAEVEPALDLLVSAMRRLPWGLLWLEEAVLDTPRWIALQAALARAGVPTHSHQRYHVARIEINHDWAAYRQTWSAKHRQKMSWCLRRLAEKGELRLVTLAELAPEEVQPRLRRALQIEDRGWKGAAGSSVLRTPGMFAFLLRQAEQLARWGQLELHVLQCGGQAIAFAYGGSAKGVYHSCKIGYDPDYAAYSPGQLLRYHVLRQFHGDPRRRAFDCQGPMTDAHTRWRPAAYTVGRLAVAAGPLGRALLCAHRYCWPYVRHLRGQSAPRRARGTGLRPPGLDAARHDAPAGDDFVASTAEPSRGA